MPYVRFSPIRLLSWPFRWRLLKYLGSVQAAFSMPGLNFQFAVHPCFPSPFRTREKPLERAFPLALTQRSSTFLVSKPVLIDLICPPEPYLLISLIVNQFIQKTSLEIKAFRAMFQQFRAFNHSLFSTCRSLLNSDWSTTDIRYFVGHDSLRFA